MAEAHEDEDTVIEEEYKVWLGIVHPFYIPFITNVEGVEEKYSLPLWLGHHTCPGVAQVYRQKWTLFPNIIADFNALE